MSRRRRGTYLIFMLGFVGLYLSATNFRHLFKAKVPMSKILQNSAQNLIHSENDSKLRSPAALVNHGSSMDRWIQRTFTAGAAASENKSNSNSFKESSRKAKAHGRELALSLLHSANSKISDDGITVIAGLRALPLEQLESKPELIKDAELLSSQWAMFPEAKMPDARPVVYDFENDRWGVMTGMVEVPVKHPSEYSNTVAGILSLGYKVVPVSKSRDTIYVASQSRSLKDIEKLSKDLKKYLGSDSIKAETLFVWRSPR